MEAPELGKEAWMTRKSKRMRRSHKEAAEEHLSVDERLGFRKKRWRRKRRL